MESEDQELPIAEFEFSEEELEEALKKRAGRPSNRTRELRARLEEARRLHDLLGILDSGVLERLARDDVPPSDGSDPARTVRIEPEIGFTAELLLKLGIIDKKFITTNQEILGMTDEVVKNALVNYSPPLLALTGVVAGLYIAEKKVKGWPPVFHLSFLILRLLSMLMTSTIYTLDAVTAFLKGGFGFLGNATKSSAQLFTDLQNQIQRVINDPAGFAGQWVHDVASGAVEAGAKSVSDPVGASQDFINHEINEYRSTIAKALSGDVIAMAELALRLHPLTFATIMAGDFILDDW